MPILLTKEDIILINQRTIAKHGGNFVPPFNLLNPSSLDYLVEAVNASIFGQPMYPSLSDKAAYYMHSIIANHVFQDGNKRTGLGAALVFLSLNEVSLRENPDRKKSDTQFPHEPLYNMTMEVASSKMNLEELKDWFSENVQDSNL